MSKMGGTCSLHRQRVVWREQEKFEYIQGEKQRSKTVKGVCCSLRHSVISAVPDGSIANMYPIEENYAKGPNNRRSPKSLAELCIDEVCRSLPYLDGDLPPGLPQNIVDDVVTSLINHSALNETTLCALQNCELGVLSLARCRGVTDEWLKPLSNRNLTSSSNFTHKHIEELGGCMDLDNHRNSEEISYRKIDQHHINCEHHMNYASKEKSGSLSSSSCSTSSFLSASTNFYGVPGTSEEYTSDDITANPIMTAIPMEEDNLNFDQKITNFPFSSSSLTSNLTHLDLCGSQRLTDEGLLHLTNLGCLEVAKFDNCHSIIGRGLLALSSSRRLHTLSLANCRRLTDEAIINISHLTSLEALALNGCRCLTDRSIAAISNLYELRKLDLSQCDLITDAGLGNLEHLEGLEELSLGWCRGITDHGLDTLTMQPFRSKILLILSVARCLLTDKGVKYLGRLRALEELDLNGCSDIGGKALGESLEQLENLVALNASYCSGILRTSWQGKINSLKSLELCYSGIKDSQLAKLTNLPSIEEINLDSCPIGDRTIAHLANNNVVPNLIVLDLADTDLTDLGMALLPKFKNLARLSLFYCNITNTGLRHVAKLTKLEALNLDSREISDEGLCHLKNLQHLRFLDIFSGRITDSGCAHIAQIKSLESLEICGGCVGDPGCTFLARLENLTNLNLSQNEGISNQGVAALASLTNLKALNLSNTGVNVAYLNLSGGLMKLQSLALYGCRGIGDNDGVHSLQNGLPSLKCLRLNTAADDDGMVVANENDYESDLQEQLEEYSRDESNLSMDGVAGYNIEDNNNVMDMQSSVYTSGTGHDAESDYSEEEPNNTEVSRY